MQIEQFGQLRRKIHHRSVADVVADNAQRVGDQRWIQNRRVLRHNERFI